MEASLHTPLMSLHTSICNRIPSRRPQCDSHQLFLDVRSSTSQCAQHLLADTQKLVVRAAFHGHTRSVEHIPKYRPARRCGVTAARSCLGQGAGLAGARNAPAGFRHVVALGLEESRVGPAVGPASRRAAALRAEAASSSDSTQAQQSEGVPEEDLAQGGGPVGVDAEEDEGKQNGAEEATPLAPGTEEEEDEEAPRKKWGFGNAQSLMASLMSRVGDLEQGLKAREQVTQLNLPA